jgi:hypothetical protein
MLAGDGSGSDVVCSRGLRGGGAGTRSGERQAVISEAMTEMLRLVHLEPGRPLADHCAGVLGVDHVAISLVVEGHVTEQFWSSGEPSSLFEDLQFTLGEGPGPDALSSGSLILLHDMRTVAPERWPALLPAMEELPVRAVFCFPLCLGGIIVGVLTLVRATPGPMSDQEVDDALALAEALTFQFLGGQGEPEDFFTDAPAASMHRAVVHQATGMISVQLGLPLGPALLRLRAHAFSHDKPINEIAREVVARRLRLPDIVPGPDSPNGKKG